MALLVVVERSQLRSGAVRVVAAVRSSLRSIRQDLASAPSPEIPSRSEPGGAVQTHETHGTTQAPTAAPAPARSPRQDAVERSALARLLAASGVAQVARAPTGTRASAGPPREVEIGGHRYAVTVFHDAAGRPSGVLVSGGGGATAMQAAFDELATWSSAQFGGGRDVRELARTEPWARMVHWSTPDADVELRGWCNAARDSRVLAVDLREGSIRAAYEAQVELLYSARGR